jgi:signal transduction histidine kinase
VTRARFGGLFPVKAARRSLVAAALAFACLDFTLYAFTEPTTGPLGPHAGLVLQMTLDLSLVLVLRYPEFVVGLVIAGALAMLGSDLFSPGLLVPATTLTLTKVPTITVAMLCTLGEVLTRRQVLMVTAVLAVLAARPWHADWSTTPLGLLTTILPALLSLYLQARRELFKSLRDRAARAEREQHLLAERARTEERRRLAGEMHDVVTHRLSLMVLHAGALGVTSADPAVRAAAEGIRSEGSRALDELRDLVGVLRDPEREGLVEGDTKPYAGHGANTRDADPAALADLAAESESVGVPVDLAVTGDPAHVSPTVARTAHRIVQEALTNVRKHAPGATVRVELDYRPDGLGITVRNTASAADADPILAHSGSGAGLLGLRQRIELIGGSLQAGPVTAGGYQVSAILPAYVPTTESARDDPGSSRR